MRRRARAVGWGLLLLATGWGGPPPVVQGPEILLPVPFVPQETPDDCGIVALQEVYRYYGSEVGRGDLMASLGYREGQGILNLQIVVEVRKRGWRAALVQGSPARLRELLEEKTPPLLMVGREGRNHFLVVTGLRPGAVRCHTGREEDRWVPEADFLELWERTGRCLLEIRPDGKEKK